MTVESSDLQIPSQIAALPCTSDGVPVTWAAAWSSELDVCVRADSLLMDVMGVAAPAYFTSGEQGDGEPRISLPHPTRVRRCVIEGLCQVCGDLLPAGPRTLLDLRIGQQNFRHGNRIVPLIVDAWTCVECLPFSLGACPFLRRTIPLTALRLKRWLLVPTLERPKWIPDAVPYGPVGFVKIAALDYETREGGTG